MPLYTSPQDWTHNTTLLLRARPTTTRIITKYTLPPLPSSSRVTKSRAKAKPRSSPASTTEIKPPSEAAKDKPPKAYLELRAYDPESGACLKYRTEKAAEVGRLIAGLGRMGRVMAALPEVEEREDVVMEDAAEEKEKVEEKTVVGKTGGQAQVQTGGQTQGQGGGKGKKKKGKR
ncbi:signal recognition particle 9 kDa protein-domain-containing protein [Elsinoe ampelina]|uniref:Signal recognition particle 9 kDa protein-domain-containing protein n=1 Tax=Elsinoe ampelina TaxID=302913 RepID=A0A6A6GKG3_9PEZI|nr:signal recognition particle 9 kDa protein-domain-containing protein [Elsinoe ampelina]